MVDLVGLEGFRNFVEDIDHFGARFGVFADAAHFSRMVEPRFDTRQQLAHPERLRNVIRRAEPERLHGRLFGRHGGKHEHGQIAPLIVGLELPKELEAVDLGHHDVEQEQIGTLFFELGEQAHRVRNGDDLVPLFSKDPAKSL